ncbi:MAG: hybrid sensor histidine kinase/response regulator [Polyangiaceae bacterium]
MSERSELEDAFLRGACPSAEVVLARTFGELWLRGAAGEPGSDQAVQALFELCPIALLEIDAAGAIEAANPCARRLLRLPEQGGSAHALGLEPSVREGVLQVARAARQHGRALVALEHGGLAYHVEAIVQPAQQRVLLCLLEADHVIVGSEAERCGRTLRAMLQSLREGVVLLGPVQLLYANDAWRELTCDAPEVLEEVVGGKSLRARLFELAAGEPGGGIDVRLGEGTSREVLAELSAVFIDYREQRCVLVVARDLTLRRRAEARVAQSERMAWLRGLFAGVAHELNNPLTYVLANLQSLASRLDGQGDIWSEDDTRQAIRDAADGCQRIAGIVRDLRPFYRADEQEQVLLDPNQLLREALRGATLSQPLPRVELQLGEVLPVLGVHANLVQALGQLIQYSLEAARERGADGSVRIRSGVRGRDVRIEVSDNGGGLTKDEVQRLFEPYGRRGKAGSGLGLSLSRNSIEQLNGWIDVDSRPGSGSRFIVHLCAAEAPDTTRVSSRASVPSSNLSQTRILVVDDEPLVARAVARLLARAAEVVCVHSIADALHVLEQRDDIELIVSDWIMPDGGASALMRHLAHRGRSGMALVVMTGLGQLGGRDAFDGPSVCKPVTRSALLQAIHEALLASRRASGMVLRTQRESSEYSMIEPEFGKRGFGQ